MKFHSLPIAAALIVAAAIPAPLGAQSAVLDQSSDYHNVDYNGFSPGLVWEQQVITGISGQLAGFELQIRSIVANDSMVVELVDGLLGGGGAVLWSGTVSNRRVNAREIVKVNVLASNIVRTAGDLFVIRIVAGSAGMDFAGNAYFPNAGYPGEFWLNGAPAGGTERLGFKTFVSDGPLLAKTGSCPGQVTLAVSGASPAANVGLVHGVPGTFTKAAGLCAGLRIYVAQPTLVSVLHADALGQASITFNAPPGLCGRTVVAVDFAACKASNGVVL